MMMMIMMIMMIVMIMMMMMMIMMMIMMMMTIPFDFQVDMNGSEQEDNYNRGFSINYRQIKC